MSKRKKPLEQKFLAEYESAVVNRFKHLIIYDRKQCLVLRVTDNKGNHNLFRVTSPSGQLLGMVSQT